MKFLSKFLLKFSFVRVLRSFLRSAISPWLRYFYYISLLIFIASIPYFVSQNKTQITHLKNRLFTKYVEFVGGETNDYNKVTIVGNEYTNYNDISKIIRNEVNKASTNQNNYFDSSIKIIKDEIQKLPWVKNVIISRNLPNDLVVKIEEHKPFAIWQDQQKKYVINKDGQKIIEIGDIEEFPDLLILSGKQANINTQSLFNMLVTDIDVGNNIYSATWVGLRRWDIRFNNNVLVKFPESNLDRAWKRLVEIYNMPGSMIDLKIIDLRVENKIYLEYNDNSLKYIMKPS